MNNLYQSFGAPEVSVTQQRTFIARVYGWMTLGLVITALAAFFTLTQQWLLEAIVFNSVLRWGLILGELGLVVVIGAAINRISSVVAGALFLLYAALNGVTLSFIMLLYTTTSVVSLFCVTAATFGLMSVYGYTTQRDLTSWGNLLLMALLGMILASLVNIFFASSTLYWITSFAGVIIFVGLIAYDTQKIKRMALSGVEGTEADKKGAINGALALYLDFINLFLMLLRLLGRRR